MFIDHLLQQIRRFLFFLLPLVFGQSHISILTHRRSNMLQYYSLVFKFEKFWPQNLARGFRPRNVKVVQYTRNVGTSARRESNPSVWGVNLSQLNAPQSWKYKLKWTNMSSGMNTSNSAQKGFDKINLKSMQLT